MMEDIICPGSSVWAKTETHDKWPAKVLRFVDKEFPLCKDHYFVLLFGLDENVWVPKDDIEAMSKEEINSEITTADVKWNKAFEDAWNDAHGLPLEESSSSSDDDSFVSAEAYFPSNVAGQTTIFNSEQFAKQKTTGKSLVVHCCIAKYKNNPIARQFKTKGNVPCVYIPKLPNSVFEASKIIPVLDKNCTFSEHSSKLNTMKGYRQESDCFKCIIPENEEQEACRIGVYQCSSLGAKISANLLRCNHQVFIQGFEGDSSQKTELEKLGARFMKLEVLRESCDVILCFSATADDAEKELLIPGGKEQETDYVFFTSMDHKITLDIAKRIQESGGRFLEAALFNRTLNEISFDQSCILLVSGSEGLYQDFRYHLNDISNYTFFMGTAGNATLMNIILNKIIGSTISGYSEALALARKNHLLPNEDCVNDFLNIISLLPLHSERFSTNTDVLKAHSLGSQLYESVNLGLKLGYDNRISMPIAAAAFVKLKNLGSPRDEETMPGIVSNSSQN